MTATPDDIQRGVKAIEGAYSQAGAWLYPDLIGHILAAVLPAHDARIRADDAEWLREWFASGPDPAQGDRLLRAFVARADGVHRVSGQENKRNECGACGKPPSEPCVTCDGMNEAKRAGVSGQENT